MSDGRTRQDTATAVNGAGLVVLGGEARHHGIERAVRSSGKKHPKIHPTVFWRNRPGRALYAGGAAAGLVGATGMGVGVHNLTRRTPEQGVAAKADSFLRQGLEGNRAAFEQRVQTSRENSHDPKSKKALAVSAAAGATTGWAGSQLTHHVLRPKHLRHGMAALAGTGLGLATMPSTNRLISHTAPGYEVTPTGVKRKKKPNRRPSSKASINRSGSPGFRQSVVPSDGVEKAGWDDHKRRAYVQAASSSPVIGPVAGPLAAARSATPGNRVASARDFALGQGAGVAVGATAGAYGAARLAQHPTLGPHVQAGADGLQQGVKTARTWASQKLGDNKLGSMVRPGEGASRFARTAERVASKIPGSARALGPLKAVPAVAAVGALLGSKVGGFTGGQAGLSAAIRRQQAKQDTSKALAQPLTSREQAENYKRKRRALAFSVGTGVTGAAGTAALGGSLLVKNPAHKTKLEHFGTRTAVLSGGITAAATVNNYRKDRRLLRDEKAHLQRQHALPVTAAKADKLALTTLGGGGRRLRVAQVAVNHPEQRSRWTGRVKVPATRVYGQAFSPDKRAVKLAAQNKAGGSFSSAKQYGSFQKASYLERPSKLHLQALAGHSPHSHVTMRRYPNVSPARRSRSWFNMQPQPDEARELRPQHKAERLKDSGAWGWQNDLFRRIPTHAHHTRELGELRVNKAFRRSSLRMVPTATPGITRSVRVKNAAVTKANYQDMFSREPGKLRLLRDKARGPEYKLNYGVNRNGMPTRSKPKIRYRTSAAAAIRTDMRDNKLQVKNGQGLTRMREHIPARLHAKGHMNELRRNGGFAKAQSSMKERDAQPYVRQYGLKGPLPSTLKDRNERMKVYEARYVAAGGPKGEKHQRRSNQYDKVTGGLVATGGASALADYASRTRAVRQRAPITARRLHGRAERAALLSGGLAAASEMMHRHHQNRAASYKHSPAGVAASALTRMQNYTP